MKSKNKQREGTRGLESYNWDATTDYVAESKRKCIRVFSRELVKELLTGEWVGVEESGDRRGVTAGYVESAGL